MLSALKNYITGINYTYSIMTKQKIGVIVVTVRKQSGPDESLSLIHI